MISDVTIFSNDVILTEVIVGVNKYKLDHEDLVDVLTIDNEAVREEQINRINEVCVFLPSLYHSLHQFELDFTLSPPV